MFQIVFDGVRAFHQVAFLLGGLLCFGIGLAIVGHEIYWRIHATRVQGVISGVRSRNAMFYTVYNYSSPTTGATVEATSTSGSNSLRGRVTGATVPLMFFPDNPEHVESANSWTLFVVGLVFALPGAIFVWIALNLAPLTPMTGVVLALFVAYAALHIKKLLRPRVPGAAPMSVMQWKSDRIAQQRAEFKALPVLPAEQLQATPRSSVFVVRQTGNPRVAGGLFLVFGTILFGVGIWVGLRLIQFVSAAVQAPGLVTHLEPVRGSHGSYSYRPVVRFATPSGEYIVFQDKLATKPPLYRGGEQVAVLYLLNDPQNSARIDHGLWKWLLPSGLIFFGGLLLTGGRKLLSSPTPSTPESSGPIQRSF